VLLSGARLPIGGRVVLTCRPIKLLRRLFVVFESEHLPEILLVVSFALSDELVEVFKVMDGKIFRVAGLWCLSEERVIESLGSGETFTRVKKQHLVN